MKKHVLCLFLALIFMAGFLSACSGNDEPAATIEPEAVEPTAEPIIDRIAAFTALDFEDQMIPGNLFMVDSTAEIVSYEDNYVLQVDFNQADTPAIKFGGEDFWDFGEDSTLSFNIINPMDEAIRLFLKVSDSAEGDEDAHSNISFITIDANSSIKLGYSFFEFVNNNTGDFGMRNLPTQKTGANFRYLKGNEALDYSRVEEIQLFLMEPDDSKTLMFDNIEILNGNDGVVQEYQDIVDRFGQNTQVDWDGKIEQPQDLLDAKAVEAEELSAYTDDSRGTYGGWLDGPQLTATGRYRTEKYDGKWWLVDPEGYLYFTTGVDVARLTTGDTATWIEGREYMYEDLPDVDGELGDHYFVLSNMARLTLGMETGTVFNHFTANLEMKYGEDYRDIWREITVQRFKSWGFTSLGNWSEPDLFFGKGEEHNMPYFANVWTSGGDHAKIPSGNEFWAAVTDPFDPQYAINLQTRIDEQLLRYGVEDDPWCIGVFVDNEIAWGDGRSIEDKYALITNVLKMDASAEDSFAKRAFITSLSDKYNDDIAKLNANWGSEFSSFDDMTMPYTPVELTEPLLEDYSYLLTLLTDKYFSMVDEQLAESLPDTLYFGCRFAEWGANEEVQTTAAKYVDVISYNLYKTGVQGEEWMLMEELDMPAVIGEFHFGAMDRGMFSGGLVTAKSQEDRGAMYTDYMNSVLANTNLIGAHWFQYMDQPLTGRAWDGENYNIGFVDIMDNPYPYMVDAARAFNGDIYERRYE